MLALKIFACIILIGYLVLRYVKKRIVYITIVSGKGEGQTRRIKDYDKITKTIKVDKPFNPVPDKTSKYKTWRETDAKEISNNIS